MKRKITTFFTLIFTFIVSVCCLIACKPAEESGGETIAKLVEAQSSETQIVMTIEEADGTANAFDALKSLRNQDLISFDYTSSVYGAYITSINGKAEAVFESTANSSKGASWMLYTSDMENAYDMTTITIDGVVCGQSSVGASSLKVKKGCLYVWVYESYEYSW